MAEKHPAFKRFDCATCTNAQKRERGCFGFDDPKRMAYWADLEGQEYNTCPRRPVMHDSSWFSQMIMYFLQWEKGYLPGPGGINDQPAKFGELMTTIKVILTEVDEAIKPPPPNRK